MLNGCAEGARLPRPRGKWRIDGFPLIFAGRGEDRGYGDVGLSREIGSGR